MATPLLVDEDTPGLDGAYDEVGDDDQMFNSELLDWLKTKHQKFSILCQHLIDDDTLFCELRAAAKSRQGVTLPVEGLTGFEEQALSGVSLSASAAKMLYQAIKTKRNLKAMNTPTQNKIGITRRYGIFIGRILFPSLTVMLTLTMYIPSLAGDESTDLKRAMFWGGFIGPFVLIYLMASLTHEVVCKEALFYFFFDEGVVLDLHNVTYMEYLTYRIPWVVLLVTALQILFFIEEQAPPQTIAVAVVQNAHYLAVFHQLLSAEGTFTPLGKIVERFPYKRDGKDYEYGKITRHAWQHCCQALKPFHVLTEQKLKLVALDLYLSQKKVYLHELFSGCIDRDYQPVAKNPAIRKWYSGSTYASNLMNILVNSAVGDTSVLIVKPQHASAMGWLLGALRYLTIIGLLIIFGYVFWSFAYDDCSSLEHRLQQCQSTKTSKDTYWGYFARSLPWVRDQVSDFVK
eukprot:TRINITY_DN67900_c1_g1_i1.p2 TRINITY_DN67900_c1_g1~~TRINITY_DN67900_c1_g1_i1.p2  ORF type:complete len:482 (-),score=76.54 TRINITY_DN67900_c1_g1_i1:1822-3198(-)